MNFRRIKYKIQHGMKLKVLFLNDNGFQYGAGIAQLRQMQSFLLLGHRIHSLSCHQGSLEKRIPFIPDQATGAWYGMRQFPELDGLKGVCQDLIIPPVVEEIKRISPDIVVAGNLHGSGWPIGLLPAIHECGCLVIAYMHDCHYITGRCTHPFSCRSFISGCDAKCSTAHEHPVLPLESITDAWELRQKIFSQYPGIALVANSRWTLDMARNAIRNPFHMDNVHLGLDHRLFRPLDRGMARNRLGLPEDAFVMVSGAVNIREKHKGGHFFEQLVLRMAGKSVFLVFGQTMGLPGIKAVGFIRDYRMMPEIFSAADLFVGTSLAESFGQTYCEASACGIPIVAFNTGGIPDIARHAVNARLVNAEDLHQFIDEISFFKNNPEERAAYGSAGRKIVESEFTLEKQAERWQHFLDEFAEKL